VVYGVIYLIAGYNFL